MLRCPVAVNDALPYRTSGPGGIANTEGTMKVLAAEEIDVPAGKFTAVRVEDEYAFGGKKCRESHWFVRDVGIVKSDFGDRKEELKSFTPGKD